MRGTKVSPGEFLGLMDAWLRDNLVTHSDTGGNEPNANGAAAGQRGLPEGWGDRGNSVSADALVRRGVIAPDVPMSQR